MQWFLDFDDTRVVGPITWAINTVLPDMIRKNGLTSDPIRFAKALLDGQRQAAEGSDEAQLLEFFFGTMGWPNSLKEALIQEVFDHYTPALFPDALPFLEHLKGFGAPVYILSNNNQAP